MQAQPPDALPPKLELPPSLVEIQRARRAKPVVALARHARAVCCGTLPAHAIAKDTLEVRMYKDVAPVAHCCLQHLSTDDAAHLLRRGFDFCERMRAPHNAELRARANLTLLAISEERAPPASGEDIWATRVTGAVRKRE